MAQSSDDFAADLERGHVEEFKIRCLAADRFADDLQRIRTLDLKAV